MHCFDSLKTKLFKDMIGGDVHFVDSSDDLGKTMLPRLGKGGMGHLCCVSPSGELLKHCIHELRFRMHRGHLEEPAETNQFLCNAMVDKPDSDTAALE